MGCSTSICSPSGKGIVPLRRHPITRHRDVRQSKSSDLGNLQGLKVQAKRHIQSFQGLLFTDEDHIEDKGILDSITPQYAEASIFGELMTTSMINVSCSYYSRAIKRLRLFHASVQRLQDPKVVLQRATHFNGPIPQMPLVVKNRRLTIFGSGFAEDISTDTEAVSSTSGSDGRHTPMAIIKRAPNKKRSNSLTKCATEAASREIHKLHPSKQPAGSQTPNITEPQASSKPTRRKPTQSSSKNDSARKRSRSAKRRLSPVPRQARKRSKDRKKMVLRGSTLGTLEEKKSAEVAAEKPSTTEVKRVHPSCSKYGLGLCVRLMSSDEPTETVAELGAPERGISVTPTTHIDISERASLSSNEAENLKLSATNDSTKAGIKKHVGGSHQAVEVKTIDTPNTQLPVMCRPIQKPFVSIQGHTPREQYKTKDRHVNVRRQPTVLCNAAVNTISEGIPPPSKASGDQRANQGNIPANQVYIEEQDDHSRSVSVMTNQSEEFSELVKLKSTSTLMPIWNVNSNNLNSAHSEYSDEEMCHSTHFIEVLPASPASGVSVTSPDTGRVNPSPYCYYCNAACTLAKQTMQQHSPTRHLCSGCTRYHTHGGLVSHRPISDSHSQENSDYEGESESYTLTAPYDGALSPAEEISVTFEILDVDVSVVQSGDEEEGITAEEEAELKAEEGGSLMYGRRSGSSISSSSLTITYPIRPPRV